MDKIIVQIYEVQTPSEAGKLMTLGVDHIGSVLVSQEDWKIPLIRETINISDGTEVKNGIIPLFNDLNTVLRLLDYYKPHIIHFCEILQIKKGTRSSCEELVSLQENIKKRFPEVKIMRSIPIPQTGMADLDIITKLATVLEPVSDYFLIDTLLVKESGSSLEQQPEEGHVGVTGQICDWNIAAKLVEYSRIPVILAGGLAPDNVFDAVICTFPAGVDSCTRTNALDSKGFPIRFKKDFDKVKLFVDETRRAERYIGQKFD